MDEDDRESNASSDREQDQQDELMEDADDAEGDNEPEEEDNDDDQDEGDREEQAGDEGQNTQDVKTGDDAPPANTSGPPATDGADDTTRVSPPAAQLASSSGTSAKSGGSTSDAASRLFPTVRPEALSARLYDIVPTMAAPQATSINAMAITPDLRYWMTGGSDGYIRKYDGPGTINGKQLLTVAQRHPFVDSVTKAGMLMSYWENEEPSSAITRGNEESVLSPVYSLAVNSQALWLLSGLESGGINLQSVRHDEGKRITCLQQHSNAVSVLSLAQDEKSVLSGSWDKTILDWDLNTGGVKRKFEGMGGQVSAIEPRTVSGAPIPAEASEMFNIKSELFSSNNAKALPNGSFMNPDGTNDSTQTADGGDAAEGEASPAHESLFGGSDTGSLFGETGGGGFGGDDDDEFSRAMDMSMHDGSGQDGGMDHSADMAMANSFGSQPAPPPEGQQPVADRNSPEAARQHAQPSDAIPDAATSAATDASQPQNPSTDSASQPPAPGQEAAPISSTQPQPSGAGSPSLMFNSQPPPPEHDPTQSSDTVFFSAAIDGTIRVWDRRVQDPVARIGTRHPVPPWCMGACWSPDGNQIYAGRRNGTVEEYSIHKARSGWEPERTLKFPTGSGAVSAVRAMPNGRHLVCASHDILRLYDLQDSAAFKHSRVPFLIIPGPPRAGVISQLYIDRTCRFMLSTAGTRGWEGSCTEVLIGYEINVTDDK